MSSTTAVLLRAMPLALIFDMDGVIVHSNPFHKKAWKAFCKQHGLDVSEDELRSYVYGKTNEDALRQLFQEDLPPEKIAELAERKEHLYRNLFEPYLVPVPGLLGFLNSSKEMYGKPAVATSAPPSNVEFVIDGLGLRDFFSVIVDETMISKGKPDPEIYLKAASCIGMDPAACIVFEDSLSGIQAARNARMTVVGITTTHSRHELAAEVDLVIDDFCELSRDPVQLRRIADVHP